MVLTQSCWLSWCFQTRRTLSHSSHELQRQSLLITSTWSEDIKSLRNNVKEILLQDDSHVFQTYLDLSQWQNPWFSNPLSAIMCSALGQLIIKHARTSLPVSCSTLQLWEFEPLYTPRDFHVINYFHSAASQNVKRPSRKQRRLDLMQN